MQTRLTSRLVVATLSVMLLWLLLGCNIALAASGVQRDVSNGKSGKIVFLHPQKSGDRLTNMIYEINPDGTGLTNVTDPSDDFISLGDVSPNGEKIAFVKNGGEYGSEYYLYMMNADGSDRTRIVNRAGYIGQPLFSPNGKKIAFLMSPHHYGVQRPYVINTDGTGLTRLTNNGEYDFIGWSRDGTKMFLRRHSSARSSSSSSASASPAKFDEVNADGSRLKKVSNIPMILSGSDWSLVDGSDWSPECKKIAFVRYSDRLYVRSPDGRETQIPHSGIASHHGWTVFSNPIFSPDCKKIAFMATRPAFEDEATKIWVINVDGTGLRNHFTKGKGRVRDVLLGWRSTVRAPSSATTLAESGGLSPMLVVAAGALALLLAGGFVAAAVVRRY